MARDLSYAHSHRYDWTYQGLLLPTYGALGGSQGGQIQVRGGRERMTCRSTAKKIIQFSPVYSPLTCCKGVLETYFAAGLHGSLVI